MGRLAVLPAVLGVAASLGAATAACGSLDGHTATPTTLATLAGTVTVPGDVKVSGSVRVALVWAAASAGDAGTIDYAVAGDVPVAPPFPARFTIDVTAAPPASTLRTEPVVQQSCGGELADGEAVTCPPDVDGATYTAAFGFVVAYVDGNHDGRLDLGSGSPDTLVATNQDELVTYFERGNDVFGDGPTYPPLGYGVAVLPSQCADTNVQPDGGLCPTGGEPTEFRSWSDAAYDLVASPDPAINAGFCPASLGAGPYGEGPPTSEVDWDVATQGTPPGGYPTPGTPGLFCQSTLADCSGSSGLDSGPPSCDGHHDTPGYSLTTCQTRQVGLCAAEVSCTLLSVGLNQTTKPAGWPCP